MNKNNLPEHAANDVKCPFCGHLSKFYEDDFCQHFLGWTETGNKVDRPFRCRATSNTLLLDVCPEGAIRLVPTGAAIRVYVCQVRQPVSSDLVLRERLLALAQAYCKKLGVDYSTGQDAEKQFHTQILACQHVLSGKDETYRTVTIVIRGGCLEDVMNLPTGWLYELIDWDNESLCTGCHQRFSNDDIDTEGLCEECHNHRHG